MFSTRAVVRMLGFCAAVTTHACAQHRGGYDSLYTDLSGADCHSEKEDKETGASVERCPGIAGYALLVQNDDDRASVTVVSPDGTQHPLDYWNVITRGFSQLGPKAEWRVTKDGDKVTPAALIIRVNASEGEPPRKRSYLAVAKITPGKTCVTRRVDSGQASNESARKAADTAANEACLEPK